MRTRFFGALLLIVSVCSTVGARDPNDLYTEQDQVIDSLQAVVKASRHDTLVCRAYLIWGEHIYLSEPDSARALWVLSMDLCNEHMNIDPPDPYSITYTIYLSNVLNNLGLIYTSLGDISKGLEYYHRSLKIHETLGNLKSVAATLSNIGTTYLSQGDMTKGLEYFHKGLKMQQKTQDSQKLSAKSKKKPRHWLSRKRGKRTRSIKA